MTDLRVLHGWYGGHAPLDVMRERFTYGPGEDRATGYLDPGEAWLTPIVGALQLDLGVRYTVVAFQAYRNGAGTEWHTDDPFDEQAVLSLGVTRTFAVRRDGEEQNIPVHHGDLVVMPSGFQDEWQHRVVPGDSTGERISLVFRTPKR